MNNLYLAIGSNIGNRYANILNALVLLFDEGINIIKHSSVYETIPYGVITQPNFLNIVLKCSTKLEPKLILRKVKDIEQRMGRTYTIKWGPRIIDIDILLYNNLVLKTEELTIPHNELKKRDFFLVPLLEIDNDLIDPETSIPLKQFVPQTKPHILQSVSITSTSIRV